MKNLLIIILVCVAFTPKAVNAQEFQWQRVAAPDTGAVRSFITQGAYLLATATQGIYRTSDYGDSWMSVADTNMKTLPFPCLLASGDFIFAGSSGVLVEGQYAGRGVYRSSNYGTTWEYTLKYGRPSIMGKSSTHLFTGPRTGAAYRSSDSGESWEECSLPSNPPYAFCAADSFLFGAGRYGFVYRTVNAGIGPWLSAGRLVVSSTITVRALHSVGGAELLAGISHLNYEGVYRTTDNGATWSPYSDGMTESFPISVYYFHATGKYLFAGTSNGVYYSINNGANWQQINKGLTVQADSVWAMQAHGGYIFAGTNQGVFRAKLPAVGVEEPPAPSLLAISPNPASEYFTVHIPPSHSPGASGSVSLTVRDVLGQITNYKLEIINGEATFSTAEYASGVYFVEVGGADGRRIVGKVVVSR